MSTNAKILLLVLGIAVLGICGGAVELTLFPHFTKGELLMVQPNGWIPGRDGYYASEVNKPNSEANLSNSQAALAEAQATKTSAEAYAVVIEANQPILTAQSFGCTFGIVFVLGAVFFGVLFFALRNAPYTE